MRKILLPAILLAFGLTASASSLGFPGEQAASVGIFIKDLKTGKIIAEENAPMALVPASTVKAVTSATALRVLGSDFRFKTTDRLRGQRSGESWNGDLEIVATADPTL
ncbi:MAG: D-alanyl-D-alanine carboxypeptidase, partial [Muribaculaceae bacterium]|nr:D-alanyl-D-alanine carboxypeptidase [Muribaculaceae bacterium]